MIIICKNAKVLKVHKDKITHDIEAEFGALYTVQLSEGSQKYNEKGLVVDKDYEISFDEDNMITTWVKEIPKEDTPLNLSEDEVVKELSVKVKVDVLILNELKKQTKLLEAILNS